MSSTREKPPEINPLLKLSIGSIISNPLPDDEILKSEGKKSLYSTTLCVIIDIIFTLIIFLEEYDFLANNFIKNFLQFSIKSFFCILILALVIILFWSRKYHIALIDRFAYLILGSIYYLAKFILKLINLVNQFKLRHEKKGKVKILDIVFLFVHLFTILPRILSFFFIKVYISKLKRIRQIKMEAEHENFVDKIASRIEKGYTRWSNPNASYTADDQKDNEENKNKYFESEEECNNKINDENENIDFEINGNKINDENNNEKEFILDNKNGKD